VFNQQIHSRKEPAPVEDFTEFEQRTAYFKAIRSTP